MISCCDLESFGVAEMHFRCSSGDVACSPSVVQLCKLCSQTIHTFVQITCSLQNFEQLCGRCEILHPEYLLTLSAMGAASKTPPPRTTLTPVLPFAPLARSSAARSRLYYPLRHQLSPRQHLS